MPNLLILLAFLFLPSISFAQTWPNEPSGASVQLDCNFNSALCSGALYDVFGGAHSVSLGDAPFSPTSAFENILPGSQDNGGAQVGYNFTGGPREIYVGFWWRTNSTFQGNFNNSNKLFFLNSSTGLTVFTFQGPQNGSSWTTSWTTDTAELNDANLHLTNQNGQDHFGLGCQVTRNTWYRWEVYIKTSTTISSRDGIVKWWISGQPCGNYTTANFPGIMLNWELNHTWTPPMPGKTQTWAHYVDHVHISFGGTPGGGGGDTTPPSQVTGLTATPQP